MSVGNSVKKIAAEFNMGLRMYQFMGGFKHNQAGAFLGTSKCNDVLQSKQQSNSLLVCKTTDKKLCFVSPKLDVVIKKSIIEPEKAIKINFELPIRNSAATALDLPLHIEKEIKEPGRVISKKAIYMIRVRRRKMRKQKRKKFQKKYAVELARRKLKRRLDDEANFQASLRTILQEKDVFSAEKYMDDLLAKAKWQRPITRVKGRLAPQWVIKEYLEEEEEKRILNERIKECSK